MAEGSENQVTAADARTFIADFVHDPKAIEGMDDTAVLAYHGKVTGALDKVRPAGKYPDTWRKDFAGDDEKAIKQFERFQSPAEVGKSYRALQQRMSSGELKANVPFPDKGTDAEKTAWRQAQGLPETHDKYEVKLPDGMVIGEHDKPLVDTFLKDAHAAHLPPAAVNTALTSYFRMQETQIAEGKKAWDGQIKATEDALRVEWGQDYRKNIGHLEGFLGEAIEDKDLRTKVLNGVKSDAGFAKVMMGMILQLDPAGTVVTGEGQNQVQAIGDEIAALKKLMGDQSSAYWRGAEAEKNQARYRELIAAQAKLTKKAA